MVMRSSVKRGPDHPRTCPMSPDSHSTPPLPELEVLLVDLADTQLPVRGRVVCPGVLVVGRMPTANVVLPASDKSAARMHFHIHLDAGHCRLTNLSERGTFVNGLLLYTQCDLRHGDLIRVGQSVFGVQVFRRGQPAELAPSLTVAWQFDNAPTTPPEEVPAPVLPVLAP